MSTLAGAASSPRQQASATWTERDGSERPAIRGGDDTMIVLKGGTLIDGTGAAPVRDTAVVIRDGRVQAVTTASANTWPKDAEIVDVSGKTVLPGLIDCHDHMALHGYDLARRWHLDEPASTRAL